MKGWGREGKLDRMWFGNLFKCKPTRCSRSTVFRASTNLALNFYWNPLQNHHMSDIKTSVLYVSGQPAMVMLDYLISNGNETRWVGFVCAILCFQILISALNSSSAQVAKPATASIVVGGWEMDRGIMLWPPLVFPSDDDFAFEWLR